MSKTPIERLLQPKSIAVIGGGNWGRRIIENSRNLGFKGPIWIVHPSGKAFYGAESFTSIDQLPAPPDAVFIGVNRYATIEAMRALRDIGAGGAVCFASGFRESKAETGDGENLQAELLDAAEGMALIGPNCYGFINYLDGVGIWPDQHGGERLESGVAILAQSSNIGMNITMQKRGLPIAFVGAIGNQAQIGMSELGATLLDDPRITALGLHIEGIDDLAAFEALAMRAHELGKPIVVLKVGASEASQLATISHTASLAGSQAGALALFNRLGIGVVESLPELMETLKLLHNTGGLQSHKIASLSCSGGEASLIADSILRTGLDFPKLNERQKTDLREALGPKVALANPLDYHTYIWGDEDGLTEAFTALIDPELAMAVVILDYPRADRCRADEWEAVINAVERAQSAKSIPMGVVSTIHENMPEDIALHLMAKGITPLCGLDEALTAMEVAANAGRAPSKTPAWKGQMAKGATTISEAEAKAVLSAHGLRVPQSGRLKTIAELDDLITKIPAPMVLKGEGFAHKSEAGAVRLGLQSRDEIAEAMEHMKAEGYLLEEMIEGAIVELLIGVVHDPAHGFVLTLALGGVWTEILRDSVSLILPVNQNEIKKALNQLRIAPILNGYRGKPNVDFDAIIKAVNAVQDYVGAHKHTLQEVEINPLIVGADFAIAVDALIKTETENG